MQVFALSICRLCAIAWRPSALCHCKVHKRYRVFSRQGSAAYEKAEDPIFVLDNNIPIDTQYYLENQLSKPLMRIFEPVLKHPNELFGKWLCLIHCLAGDHTRAVSITMPSSGIMGKFSTKADVCVGCKALLGADEQTVCRHCRPKIGELYMRQVLPTLCILSSSCTTRQRPTLQGYGPSVNGAKAACIRMSCAQAGTVPSFTCAKRPRRSLRKQVL